MTLAVIWTSIVLRILSLLRMDEYSQVLILQLHSLVSLSLDLRPRKLYGVLVDEVPHHFSLYL